MHSHSCCIAWWVCLSTCRNVVSTKRFSSPPVVDDRWSASGLVMAKSRESLISMSPAWPGRQMVGKAFSPLSYPRFCGLYRCLIARAFTWLPPESRERTLLHRYPAPHFYSFCHWPRQSPPRESVVRSPLHSPPHHRE